MAYHITQECISCGACVDPCPNQAISPGDPIYVVDPAKCTECVGFYDEPQCALVCPVGAPQPDPDHKETREELETKAAKFKAK